MLWMRRPRRAEPRAVDGVEARPVIDADDVRGDAHQMRRRAAGGGEDLQQVVERLRRLRLERRAGEHRAVGPHRQLSRDEQQVAGQHGLRVVASRRRRTGRQYGAGHPCFGHHQPPKRAQVASTFGEVPRTTW